MAKKARYRVENATIEHKGVMPTDDRPAYLRADQKYMIAVDTETTGFEPHLGHDPPTATRLRVWLVLSESVLALRWCALATSTHQGGRCGMPLASGLQAPTRRLDPRSPRAFNLKFLRGCSE